MVAVKDTARLRIAALIDLKVEDARILAPAYPFQLQWLFSMVTKAVS